MSSQHTPPTGGGSPAAAPAEGTQPVLWVFRGVASLLLLVLLGQATTAGQLLEGSQSMRAAHSTGGMIAVVLGLALLIVAVLVWRRGIGWPTLVSLVVLLATAGQFMLGMSGGIAVHIPLGTVLVGSAAFLVTWGWAKQRI